MTGFVVFVERAQRRITVNYAKRQRAGACTPPSRSHLPFKINMSGVIPPIFASSMFLFPATLANLFGSNPDSTSAKCCRTSPASLGYGQPLHCVVYATLIVFFCFFYTALVFNSRETAENLKKSGAFIPGIRPGPADRRVHRRGADPADPLGRPLHHRGVPAARDPDRPRSVPFYFGGTSLLIIVVVVMDFMAQLQAHMMSHHYEGLLKKANLKGYGRAARRKFLRRPPREA